MTRAKTGQPITGETEFLIERIGSERLAEYCAVPSLVEVHSILQVKSIDDGFGGLALELVPVPTPYIKSVAVFQFGTAGLGITIVSLLRKESFVKHGLTSANLPKAVILSALATLPHLAYRVSAGTLTGYMPFRQVRFTNEILASGFPVNVIGMAVVATAWGFFEGLNYAFISDKIHKLYLPKGVWLNWGAIACGVFCLLIHGLVGVTPDALMEAVTVFAIIYGMLVVKEQTGNAWGTVFVFLFFWNAI